MNKIFMNALLNRVYPGKAVKCDTAEQSFGGDINRAYKLNLSSGGKLFVKLNSPRREFMFAAEAKALGEIAQAGYIRTPEVIAAGQLEGQSYILMEFINMGAADLQTARDFGKSLALMHNDKQPYFGWDMNNTIGSTPQNNDPEDNWPVFWQKSRMAPQLKMAATKGLTGATVDKGYKLLERLNGFFPQMPAPSLLHGDLWGGNWSADEFGKPVIYDPASYYGDREADIAMTELFGRFPAGFYDSYQEVWELPPEYRQRKDLYNLYHVLNHYNLFGGGYDAQAAQLIERLLAIS